MNAIRNASFAALFGLSTLAGCSLLDNDSRSSRRDSDRSSDRIDRVDRSDRNGDVERASSSSNRIPRDARVVEETRGGRIQYTARDSGTIYLADADADTVVWSGRVRDGDRVVVDPDKNRIEINGKEQASIDLKSNHRFQLLSSERR